VYLPDTSEVLRSAQKGDLFQFEKVGKVRLNDLFTLTASPGPGNLVTISHGLGYIPVTVLLKQVTIGSVVTWVDATGTVDIVHNAGFTETTITNTVAAPIEFILRIGWAMTVSPTDLQNDGFGTILSLLNEGPGSSGLVPVSITTTNAVSSLLYSTTVAVGGTTSIRATIVAIRSSGAVIGKFVREFTVKRVGAGSALLVQDLVPSPDYAEDLNLAITDTVSGPNAVILVTGLSGTVDWHGLIEVIS
jgi:hypothetical protein